MLTHAEDIMSIEDIAAKVAETIQKEANINAIFGEPKKLDEHTIVPVARVEISMGGGGGGGKGPAPKQEDDGEEGGGTVGVIGGTGGGGGLDIEVRPLGFIRDTADGAEFVAIDPTPEGLLGKVEHLIKGIRTGQGSKSADD
jgi:uncharacterized spore protein YtfJ